MRIADDIVAEPAEFVPGGAERNLSELGLTVKGTHWGDAAVEAAMVKLDQGQVAASRYLPPREPKLALTVREDSGADLPTAARDLQQVVNRWQQEGGWLRRDFYVAGDFAGSLGLRVHAATLTDFAGWQAGESPDVALSLVTDPIWYAAEEIESAAFEETSARELIFKLEGLLGTAPGLIRLRIDNDNTGTNHWRAAIAAVESRDYSSASTANLAYECEALTPKGGAAEAALAGASNGKVVEHTGLTAGWIAVLSSKIVASGHMSHKGDRRVRLRIHDPGSEAGNVELKLEWRALGSLKWTPEAVVPTPLVGGFADVELGTARPQRAVLGSERWEWRVLARAANGSGTIRLDRVRLLPTEQIVVVRSPAETPSADTQSTKSPGTVADESGVGSVTWSNPTNAASSNDTRATAVLPSVAATSHYLKATNFGFALPEGATVLGIVAGVERSKEGGYCNDIRVRIVKGGAIKEAEDKASFDLWTAVDTYKFYGAADELWGQTWTPAEINNSGFGLALAAIRVSEIGGSVTARVDHIKITVYYTEAADENRVCFATRSMEFRSDGVYRQHPEDDVWGRLIPEDGFYLSAPPAALEDRTARVIVLPSQGDLDEAADANTNKLTGQVFYRPGYLFAREAA